MDTISCKEMRDHMAEVINRVAYGHKRYTLIRHKEPVAVLLSFKEWKPIEALLEKQEDAEDIRDADEAHKRYLKEGGVPIKEVKKELGL